MNELPKVSIVVTAYLPASKPYLDACIASIKNLEYPKDRLEVLLVCPTWYMPEYDGVRRVVPAYGAYHNPVAVNYGMAQASKDSKYLFMMNDDVILTRQSIGRLVWAAGDSDVVLSPISNCDNLGHYQFNFPLGLNDRQYRMEQIEGKLQAMMNAESPFPQGYVFPNTLYLYANLYPRKVWEKVGGFDEEFKTGFDDTDWCMRAQRAGVKLAIALDSLAWHMSGASADKTMGNLNSDIRADNERYFRKKWNIPS